MLREQMTEPSEEHQMAERILGIDIGGSGIKGAVVVSADASEGRLPVRRSGSYVATVLGGLRNTCAAQLLA